MTKFTKADDEFSIMAKELYLEHQKQLGLTVHPSRVMFLRKEKKKGAFAYCKRIGAEAELLTDKKFFIVVVSENYDALESEEQKEYVILHELKHLHYDDEKDKYCRLKHNVENFTDLLVNPNWNLSMIKEAHKANKEKEPSE